MGDAVVALLYRPSEGGREIRVGTTRDDSALRAVKTALLDELEERTAELSVLDPALEALESGELYKLRRVLAVLIPGQRGSRLAFIPRTGGTERRAAAVEPPWLMEQKHERRDDEVAALEGEGDECANPRKSV